MAEGINEKPKRKRKKKRIDKSIPLNLRLGSSSMDMDIKSVLKNYDNNSGIFKNILRSFVMETICNYKPSNNYVSPEYLYIKISLSKVHDEILYNWYKYNIVGKTLNKSGVLKNIVHYQIFQEKSRIQIDIDNFRLKEKDEINVPELTQIKNGRNNKVVPMQKIFDPIEKETENNFDNAIGEMG